MRLLTHRCIKHAITMYNTANSFFMSHFKSHVFFKTIIISWTYVIGLFLCSFLTSCHKQSQQDRIKKEIRKMMGSKIDFNFEMNEISTDTIIFQAVIPEDCYRIVSFIPKIECSKCMLKIIPVMDTIAALMNKSECTKLVIITDYNDNDELQKTLGELNVSHSIYVDINNKFLEKNEMTNVMARNKTILVDKNGKIVLVGEPFHNTKMKDLYLSVVSNEQ